MSALPDGGPAFPNHPPLDPEGGSASGYPFPAEGMTLRDYFAAQALQGLIVADNFYAGMGEPSRFKQAAEGAYAFAEAMLRKRDQ